jgi:hypothetical protein
MHMLQLAELAAQFYNIITIGRGDFFELNQLLSLKDRTFVDQVEERMFIVLLPIK